MGPNMAEIQVSSDGFSIDDTYAIKGCDAESGGATSSLGLDSSKCSELQTTQAFSILASLCTGIGFGMFFIMYTNYSRIAYYGAILNVIGAGCSVIAIAVWPDVGDHLADIFVASFSGGGGTGGPSISSLFPASKLDAYYGLMIVGLVFSLATFGVALQYKSLYEANGSGGGGGGGAAENKPASAPAAAADKPEGSAESTGGTAT